MIYIVVATTEAEDSYYFAFKSKPTREAVIRLVAAEEDMPPDYQDLIRVTVKFVKVRK